MKQEQERKDDDHHHDHGAPHSNHPSPSLSNSKSMALSVSASLSVNQAQSHSKAQSADVQFGWSDATTTSSVTVERKVEHAEFRHGHSATAAAQCNADATPAQLQPTQPPPLPVKLEVDSSSDIPVSSTPLPPADLSSQASLSLSPSPADSVAYPPDEELTPMPMPPAPSTPIQSSRPVDSQQPELPTPHSSAVPTAKVGAHRDTGGDSVDDDVTISLTPRKWHGWIYSARRLEQQRGASVARFNAAVEEYNNFESGMEKMRALLNEDDSPAWTSLTNFDDFAHLPEQASMFTAVFEVKAILDWKEEFEPETRQKELMYLIEFEGCQEASWQLAENPCPYEDALQELEKRTGKPVPRIEDYLIEKGRGRSHQRVTIKQETKTSRSKSRGKDGSVVKKEEKNHSAAAATPSPPPKRRRTSRSSAPSPATATHASMLSEAETESEEDDGEDAARSSREPVRTPMTPPPSRPRRRRRASGSCKAPASGSSLTSPSRKSATPSRRTPSRRTPIKNKRKPLIAQTSSEEKEVEDEEDEEDEETEESPPPPPPLPPSMPNLNYHAFRIHSQLDPTELEHLETQLKISNHFHPSVMEQYKPLWRAQIQLVEGMLHELAPESTSLSAEAVLAASSASSIASSSPSASRPSTRRTTRASLTNDTPRRSLRSGYKEHDVIVKKEPGLEDMMQEAERANVECDGDQEKGIGEDDADNEKSDSAYGRPSKRRRLTRSSDSTDAVASFDPLHSSTLSDRALSFADVRMCTDALYSLVRFGGALPQRVFEWCLNRMLSPPAEIDVEASQQLYHFLCNVLPDKPQWFLLSSHHIQLAYSILDFVLNSLQYIAREQDRYMEQLTSFVEYHADAGTTNSSAASCSSSSSSVALSNDAASVLPTALERVTTLQSSFFISMLRKYLLVINILYMLYATDLQRTSEYNDTCRRERMQERERQREMLNMTPQVKMEVTDQSSAAANNTAAAASATTSSAASSAATATATALTPTPAASALSSSASSRRRSRGSTFVPAECALRLSLRASSGTNATMYNLQKSKLAPLSELLTNLIKQQQMYKRNYANIPPLSILPPRSLLADWLDTVEYRFMDLIMQMEKLEKMKK